MTSYITPQIEVDPAALANTAFDYLIANIPGWTPNPGNLDVLLIEALAQVAAELAEVAAAVPSSIFRYLGPLAGAPALEASPASATATVVLSDALGHTVPAGSSFGLRDADGTLWTMATVADLVIGAALTSGTVVANNDVEGSAGNGLLGVAELIDVPPFVQSVTLAAPTSGGTDPEDDDVYLDRLAETLALLSPRPILPNDFAVLSRSVAGVFRAAAIDMLKPGPPYSVTAEATNQERTITVAVASTTGDPTGAPTRAAVDLLLQSERELNFAVYVVDPIYATIDVTFTVKCWPDATPSVVQAAAIAAVQAWLSPATWGADSSGDATTWLDERVVRLGEVYEVLNRVSGVRYVQGAPTLALTGNVQAAADLAIGAGTAIPVLTRAGVISGTAVA